MQFQKLQTEYNLKRVAKQKNELLEKVESKRNNGCTSCVLCSAKTYNILFPEKIPSRSKNTLPSLFIKDSLCYDFMIYFQGLPTIKD